MAVHKHNALLKASIMTAQNAHRLGANEAPPAIVSAFLGTQLSAILDKIENSTSEEAIIFDNKRKLHLGIPHIPEVFLDNTDRNRTSAFAFTGNRFEFRAVGSSANCSSAMATLNTAMAAQLFEFKAEVDAKMASGIEKEKAIFDVIKSYIKASKAIRFDGNGYSDEWKVEAAKRGLDCETSVPKIIEAYTSASSVELFTKMGVLTEKELHARNEVKWETCVPKIIEAYTSKSSIELFKTTGVLTEVELHARNEVKWETYVKKIQIEARVLGDLAINHIIPVATRYQSMLLDNVYKTKAVFSAEKAEKIAAQDMALIEEIAERISNIKTNVDAMVEARKVANNIEHEDKKANTYHDVVLPYFDVIRYNIDKLELVVDDEMWTLPKYRELLFIR
jgi:glutamine synthetase